MHQIKTRKTIQIFLYQGLFRKTRFVKFGFVKNIWQPWLLFRVRVWNWPLLIYSIRISVARFGNLKPFGLLFEPFGNQYFALTTLKISHFLSYLYKIVKKPYQNQCKPNLYSFGVDISGYFWKAFDAGLLGFQHCLNACLLGFSEIGLLFQIYTHFVQTFWVSECNNFGLELVNF